jgi:oligopeptide transport system substrate-binding protein
MMRLSTVCIALLVISACTNEQGQSSAPEDAGLTVFHRGNGPDPDTLDPHRSEETAAAAIIRDLFEGLTTEDVAGNIVPGVAESWTVSDDGSTYRFTLRPDARWSNGDPVTAEDFVAGMRRTVDPATASTYAQILFPIINAGAIIAGEMPATALGVTAVDDHELRIDLTAPTPYFIQLMAHSASYPLHRASFAAFGAQFTRPGNLVSNGAYLLTDWVVNSHVRLAKNPYYSGRDGVQIDVVYYHNTEDTEAELRRFRAGELDYTSTIPNSQFAWVKENLGAELHISPYLSVYFYGFDVTEPPFDDVRLRQALTMALDRDVLTQQVTGIGELPAYGIVPPGVSNYEFQRFEWADLDTEERLAEARRLYAAAGYSDARPLRTEIRYNTSDNHRRIAVALASMWKSALGIDAQIVNVEWKVMLQDRRNPALWEIMRYGWVGDYNDAFTFLEVFQSGHGQNFTGFSDAEFDGLVARAAVEQDLTVRAGLMAAAERRLLEQYPVIPLYFYVSKHLVKPYVQGYTPNILDHDLSRHYRVVHN